MNTRVFQVVFSLLAGGLAASAVQAATLTFDAPLQLRPAEDAPVVATLPAGSTVTVLVRDELEAEGIQNLPAGWVAVHYRGSLRGFVGPESMGKDDAVRPGSVVRAAASHDAPIITMVTEADAAEAVGADGEWTEVVLTKEKILFLNPVPPASRAKIEPEPVVADAPPAPTAPAGPTLSDAAPRVFQGYLTRTRRILGRGPKLDYQLVDDSNRRIALLDISALLLTEPIESFEGREVTVFGPGLKRPDVEDLIIRAETVRLVRH